MKQRLFLILSLLLTSCGVLQVSIDNTDQQPPVDNHAQATIQALQTQNARLIQTENPELLMQPWDAPLNLQSDSEIIRLKLLYSYTLWDSVWMDGTVTWQPPEGLDQPTQTYHQQMWVDQGTPLFRLLSALDYQPIDLYKVCDGQTILEMNPINGQTQSSSLGGYARSAYNPPRTVSDTIEPHPLDGVIGSPFGSAIFPSGLAQRGGNFITVSMETAAGRPALVTDWYREIPGERVDRFWIDVETGIILRWQNYSKAGGEVLNHEYLIQTIQYNLTFPPDLFRIPPVLSPAFSEDAAGKPMESPSDQLTPIPASLDVDPSGEFYLTLMSTNAYPDGNIRLARLPGSCVAGVSPCPTPALQLIPGYPNKNSSIVPLRWSRDGQYAVVAYPTGGDAASSSMTLYLFSPGDLSWRNLAEMTVIEQPHWSPDGKFILFQGQEDDSRDLFLSDIDGKLTNLTKGRLTGEFNMLVMGGWIGSHFLFSFGNPNQATMYLLDPDTEVYQEFPVEFPPGKSQFIPSLDGQHIAITGYDGSGVSLKVYNSSGKNPHQVANFQNTSLNIHAWSSDSQTLLFTGNGPKSNDAYLVGLDGSDFRQIYSGSAILEAIYSADGQYVVIEDSNETGFRLFIYSLASNSYQMLNVPGLDLADAWRAPSWRPISPLP